MLGFVRGKIISKSLDSTQCVVLAHRVGYEVTLPKPLFERLELEETASFWVHTHVREEALTLFGFETDHERQLFRTLLSVSGLGPKTALALLATHNPAQIPELILAKDSDSLSEAPGVGKKLAQKIVLELVGKMEKLAWVAQITKGSERPRSKPASPQLQIKDDLASALQHLGYPPNFVKVTVEKLLERAEPGAARFEELLKAALKELSGRVENPAHG